MTEEKQALEAVLQAVCDDLAAGEGLREVCERHGIAAKRLYRERLSNAGFDAAYRRARELGIDARIDDLDGIAERTPDVQRARLMCDNRKWAASKLVPHVYGDRLDVNVTQTVDIRGALERATARVLRPNGDPADAIDVEYRALPGDQADGPTDKESAGPEQTPALPGESDPEPDIFS